MKEKPLANFQVMGGEPVEPAPKIFQTESKIVGRPQIMDSSLVEIVLGIALDCEGERGGQPQVMDYRPFEPVPESALEGGEKHVARRGLCCLRFIEYAELIPKVRR